jgi:predicted transcriptional regulator YheO
MDQSLFFVKEENNLIGVICLHVDDILWGGNKNFMENYINKLKNTYDVGKENKENFKFLGMKIRNIDKNLIKVE